MAYERPQITRDHKLCNKPPSTVKMNCKLAFLHRFSLRNQEGIKYLENYILVITQINYLTRPCYTYQTLFLST